MLNVWTVEASHDGDNITLYEPTSHATQIWTLEESGGGYVVRPSDNASLAMTVDANRNVCLKANGGADSQRWTFEDAPADGGGRSETFVPAVISPDDYRLKCGSLYLTANADSDGGNVTAAASGQANAQTFSAQTSGTDYVFAAKSSASGRRLNVWTTDESHDGDNVTLYSPTGHPTQAWTLEKSDGAYVLHPSDNYALALTVTSDGNACLKKYSGAGVQLWNLEKVSGSAFQDAVPGSFYYPAMEWAIEKGITNGTSATKFSPGNSCTRAQVVTFLWRAFGSPEPKSQNNPFTDVKPGSYYYKAVLWAVEEGITNGATSTTFAPNAVVSRAQAVTFLYRCAGKKPETNSANFKDVEAGKYYFDAVNWAVQSNITNGTSASTFSPQNNCTRAHIVTFLQRCFGA